MYAEQRGGRYLPVRAAVVETFVHQLQHDHAVAVSDNHLGHNVISEAWEHAPIRNHGGERICTSGLAKSISALLSGRTQSRERSFVYPSSTVGPFRPFADETDARQTPDECIRGTKIDLRPKIDLP